MATEPAELPTLLITEYPFTMALPIKIYGKMPGGRRYLVCEVDEPELAEELARRWNAFRSRSELIQEARVSAAEMKRAAQAAEDQGLPHEIVSGNRKVALVLTHLAIALDQDQGTLDIALRGGELIEHIERWATAHRANSDATENRLRELFDAWLDFQRAGERTMGCGEKEE